MSVNIVNLFDAARRHRDWTNRELGEFYRVESMLARAGLDVETDRGLTDEGDPWFVFCHAVTGDVIAHLARYDGFYVIASAMLENSIRGRDFRALIETMLRTYTVALPAKDEAGVKVSIHPSALLVSLIMICFFKLSVTQSDAFEATTLNPPDHLASDPDFNGVDASAMDEHHSRAFIAAIAFAVGWSYAVGADNQTPAVELGSFFGTEQSQEHSGAAITISGELSGTAPSDALRDHSGSPSMAIVDANDANPDLLVNPAVVAQSLHGGSNDARGAATAGNGGEASDATHSPDLSLPEFQNGRVENISPPSMSHSVDGVAERSGNPVSASSPEISANLVANHDATPEAMRELAQFAGEFPLAVHLLQDPTQAQPELVLKVVEQLHQEASLGQPAQASTTTPDNGAMQALVASASATPDTSAIEAELATFLSSTSDYKVLTKGPEVIIFDAGINASNAINLKIHEWDFADGSSIVLIGVSDHHPGFS